jgi:hypothetical protein
LTKKLAGTMPNVMRTVHHAVERGCAETGDAVLAMAAATLQ